ncbi:unnamed protein product [Rhizophagus irregularis]|nr:unnamed protein product [Rhizophagus irregularis]
MLQQFKNRNKSRFNSYADATKGNRNPSNRHRHWNQNNIITQQRNNNTYTFNEEEMQAWGDEEDINDNNHNPIQDGTRKGGSMHDPNTNKRTSSQNDLSDFKKQLTTLNTMIIEFRKENDIVRKEINSIKKTFKNNNNCKGPQHKPNKLPIVNNNNKRAKPDSSSSENDDNNLVLNLESRVEKQDSLLNNMFNMITKLTGQLSDKEQNDSTTNKIASIGEDNTIPNQINDNIDMFNEHDNQKYFTKIAVLNICTLTEYKLNNIFDYIRKNGVDIMGITETQKADKEINFFNADKAGYKIISHNDNKNAIGKGVLLIIRNNLEKHIFNIEKINGRILIVDFSFKNNKKLRLILFYNLANHRTGVDMNNKINMNTHVINQIKIAKSQKMEIICCGNFNLQYKRFKKRQDNKQSIPKMLKMFQKLEDLNLWDVHKETYDMDNTKEIMTYFGRFNSRIDYIWISENFFTKTLNAKIINISDIIKTDHALLTFDFINEDLIYLILQTKKLNTTNTNLIRHIFDFDTTEEKDLLNFQDDLKKVAISFNLNGSIEEKWSFFKDNLLKIK